MVIYIQLPTVTDNMLVSETVEHFNMLSMNIYIYIYYIHIQYRHPAYVLTILTIFLYHKF